MGGIGVGEGCPPPGWGTGGSASAISSSGMARTPSQGSARRATVPRRSRWGVGGGPASATVSGRPRGNEPYGRSALVGTNLVRVYQRLSAGGYGVAKKDASLTV